MMDGYIIRKRVYCILPSHGQIILLSRRIVDANRITQFDVCIVIQILENYSKIFCD